MRYAIALIAVLLCGIAHANTVDGALKAYYDAAMAEDIGTYMASLDQTDMDALAVEMTRDLALETWKRYDTDEYLLSGLDYVIDDEGDYSLAIYRMRGRISGYEGTLEEDLDYVSLLHKVGGDWKIVFAMPYSDYIESTDELRGFSTKYSAARMAEEYYSWEPNETAGILLDGEPMSDLSHEMEAELNSCTSDEYCQRNGLGDVCDGQSCIRISTAPECARSSDCPPGYGCDGGRCVPRPEGCPAAIFLMLLTLGLFIKK
ncbi:MAG: hypothetical protein ABII71_04030 [Candidatus Micrarchaeota archaeon]